MSGDLISRSDLGVDFCNPDVFENKAYAEGWNSLIKIIKEAPTVDAEPVRHGRWSEPYPNDIWDCYKCSECGNMTDRVTLYCPNCGAKMDAEGT